MLLLTVKKLTVNNTGNPAETCASRNAESLPNSHFILQKTAQKCPYLPTASSNKSTHLTLMNFTGFVKEKSRRDLDTLLLFNAKKAERE